MKSIILVFLQKYIYFFLHIAPYNSLMKVLFSCSFFSSTPGVTEQHHSYEKMEHLQNTENWSEGWGLDPRGTFYILGQMWIKGQIFFCILQIKYLFFHLTTSFLLLNVYCKNWSSCVGLLDLRGGTCSAECRSTFASVSITSLHADQLFNWDCGSFFQTIQVALSKTTIRPHVSVLHLGFSLTFYGNECWLRHLKRQEWKL